MDTRIYRSGWLGAIVFLNSMVIVLWMGTLLGYAGMQLLLPYQMNWFTIFPYLLAMLLCIPRQPRLLCLGVAAANAWFCGLYLYALLRIALGQDPGSMSPLWSLIVFGAGTTALNLGLALVLGLGTRSSAARAASVKAA